MKLPFFTPKQKHDLLYTPVKLERGTRQVTHCCPILREDGFSEDEATSTLVLVKEGTTYFARCKHCGTAVEAE